MKVKADEQSLRRIVSEIRTDCPQLSDDAAFTAWF